MVKTKIIKFCIAAFEEKMLKIYATIMTGIFLAIWIPAMIGVAKEFIQIFDHRLYLCL